MLSATNSNDVSISNGNDVLSLVDRPRKQNGEVCAKKSGIATSAKLKRNEKNRPKAGV